MTPGTRPGSSVETRIVSYRSDGARPAFDRLATEEPMEIRLRAGTATHTAAVTMRTPGNDFELAAGFAYNEGILRSRDGLRGITYCVDRDVDEAQRFNIVNVDLAASELPALARLERHFVMNSACGVCGTATIAALRERDLAPVDTSLTLASDVIGALPARLRDAQRVFDATGGLHAAALFELDGTLVAVREDVGRHNALDKLVGWALMEGRLPLRDRVLLVSGRASYELVQKCVSAGIPFMCAVSAPSSLAVDVARAFGLTLCGFVRDGRFNVYAGAERITTAAPATLAVAAAAGHAREGVS